MLMLEYRSKEVFASAGLSVPPNHLITRNAASSDLRLPFGFPVAVKAQVFSGRRGQSGGVVRCDDPESTFVAVNKLFDAKFDGEQPDAILIEPWVAIERELYLAVTIDGAADGYVLLYAPRGGMEVESGPSPVRYAFGLPGRFRTHEFRTVLATVEPDIELRERLLRVAETLVRIASNYDCNTVEINPLALLSDGALMAMDAKIDRDEWSSYRHADVAVAIAEANRKEVPAVQKCIEVGHMYVRLDGDIGIISGGAGMTMAVMDLIAHFGGRAACFLDCSPGPITAEGYAPAFSMLEEDPKVKAILVSVFGGGTQMQHVASAMCSILTTRKMTKPMVFRLNGTNVDQATAILAGIGVQNVGNLEEAVRNVVKLSEENR